MIFIHRWEVKGVWYNEWVGGSLLSKLYKKSYCLGTTKDVWFLAQFYIISLQSIIITDSLKPHGDEISSASSTSYRVTTKKFLSNVDILLCTVKGALFIIPRWWLSYGFSEKRFNVLFIILFPFELWYFKDLFICSSLFTTLQ